MSNEILQCPICESSCTYLDTVDSNKTCTGIIQPIGGPVPHYLCDNCQFCFAPMYHTWTKAMFLEHIYNEGYIEFDPEYVSARPLRNANHLLNIFQDVDKSTITHLDYGGGNGALTRALQESGWDSESFDSLVDEKASKKKFNLITAFEVLEHIPHIHQVMQHISELLHDDGVVMITTALSDTTVVSHGVPLDWWYASPRNGHISLFSPKSLDILATQHGLSLVCFSSRYVLLFKENIPAWMPNCVCDLK